MMTEKDQNKQHLFAQFNVVSNCKLEKLTLNLVISKTYFKDCMTKQKIGLMTATVLAKQKQLLDFSSLETLILYMLLWRNTKTSKHH